MKKTLITFLILAQGIIPAENKPKVAVPAQAQKKAPATAKKADPKAAVQAKSAANTNTKAPATPTQTKPAATTKAAPKTTAKKDEVKKFKTLQEAADDYAKAMQEISNYGSREMLRTVNVDVDKYVGARGDQELTRKWEEINTMLLEQFEVSVYKVNENGNSGEAVFLIKGYDEEALSKYLNDNIDKYAKIKKLKGEVDIDIEAYINLQYNYLKNAKKINIATSTVNFVKTGNEWKKA